MGVVGTVVDMPCCSVGGMVHVASGVRPPCVGSLMPRTRLGRGVDCARGRGSVGAGIASEAKGSSEMEIASEAKGSGEMEIAPEAKGSGETEIAPEAEGSDETEIAPEAEGSGVAFILFATFYLLNLSIPVYGTLQVPKNFSFFRLNKAEILHCLCNRWIYRDTTLRTSFFIIIFT